MMIPGGPWLRPLNFVITSLVVSFRCSLARRLSLARTLNSLLSVSGTLQFVYVSNQVAGATGSLTEWICNKGAALPRSNPPTRGAAVAPPPTGGTGATTGEYVALSTVGADGGVEEKSAPLPQQQQQSAMGRGMEFVKKDLRVKFLAIMVGLWVLNEVCECSGCLSLSLFLSRARARRWRTGAHSPVRFRRRSIVAVKKLRWYPLERAIRVCNHG